MLKIQYLFNILSTKKNKILVSIDIFKEISYFYSEGFHLNCVYDCFNHSGTWVEVTIICHFVFFCLFVMVKFTCTYWFKMVCFVKKIKMFKKQKMTILIRNNLFESDFSGQVLSVLCFVGTNVVFVLFCSFCSCFVFKTHCYVPWIHCCAKRHSH